jgi:hypothetical protein
MNLAIEELKKVKQDLLNRVSAIDDAIAQLEGSQAFDSLPEVIDARSSDNISEISIREAMKMVFTDNDYKPMRRAMLIREVSRRLGRKVNGGSLAVNLTRDPEFVNYRKGFWTYQPEGMK